MNHYAVNLHLWDSVSVSVCVCVCVCVCMCVFAMHVCTLGYVQEVMQLCLNVCRVLSDFNFS